MAGIKNISYDYRRTQYSNTTISGPPEDSTKLVALGKLCRILTIFRPSQCILLLRDSLLLWGKYAICIDSNPADPNFEFIDAVNPSDDGKTHRSFYSPRISIKKGYITSTVFPARSFLASLARMSCGASQMSISRLESVIRSSSAFICVRLSLFSDDEESSFPASLSCASACL
ncbi:hypothetical protein EV421DRAFT_1800672 [Armillaria borealis]|uniref:Uncharacterized protein n=1 Tax=Armillaria borealis TaxID=47425 RepID=A0AA39JM04_9AGAR|nr:hypothetical protein EV421DRAFT_1800672 [Armillaria borealis]